MPFRESAMYVVFLFFLLSCRFYTDPFSTVSQGTADTSRSITLPRDKSLNSARILRARPERCARENNATRTEHAAAAAAAAVTSATMYPRSTKSKHI